MKRGKMMFKFIQGCSGVLFLLLFTMMSLAGLAQDAEAPVTLDSTYSYTEKEQPVFDLLSDSSTPEIRTVPDSMVQKLKKDEAYWYVNTTPPRQKIKQAPVEQKNRWFQKQWVSTLLWIIVIITFLAILAWFLASSNIRLFRKKLQGINGDEEIEVENENIFTLNYQKELHKALAGKKYRLATRLLYLQTLKDLAESNVIQYKHDRTNRDYVDQLFNTGYYKDFFKLTRNFEYIWYGKFDLSAEAFTKLQTDFSNFNRKLQP